MDVADQVYDDGPLVREVEVTLTVLRELLREQTIRISDSGSRALRDATTTVQLKHEEYLALIEARVQRLSDQCNSLACKLQQLEDGRRATMTVKDCCDNCELGKDTVDLGLGGKKKKGRRRRSKVTANKDGKPQTEVPIASDRSEEQVELDGHTVFGCEGSESRV